MDKRERDREWERKRRERKLFVEGGVTEANLFLQLLAWFMPFHSYPAFSTSVFFLSLFSFHSLIPLLIFSLIFLYILSPPSLLSPSFLLSHDHRFHIFFPLLEKVIHSCHFSYFFLIMKRWLTIVYEFSFFSLQFLLSFPLSSPSSFSLSYILLLSPYDYGIAGKTT